MIRGWRAAVMAIVLALGVTGIGATAVFGMTPSSAVATASVDAGAVSEDVMCLLHCLTAHDVHVGSGMLAIAVTSIIAVLTVMTAFFAVEMSTGNGAQPVFVVSGSPGRRYFMSKRE